MSIKLMLILVVALLCIGSVVQAEIIRNGGFETVPEAYHDQGILPSEWMQIGYVGIGADTYDTTGAYGLWPSEYGHFAGVGANDGTRWVAGYVGMGESFGQLLTAPLVAGQEYEFSAFLHSSDFGMGGYSIYLTPTASETGKVYLGRIGLSVSGAWEACAFGFIAPDNAQVLPYLVISPDSGYPGIDSVSLNAVPEPASITVLGAGVLSLLLRRKRRN